MGALLALSTHGTHEAKRCFGWIDETNLFQRFLFLSFALYWRVFVMFAGLCVCVVSCRLSFDALNNFSTQQAFVFHAPIIFLKKEG